MAEVDGRRRQFGSRSNFFEAAARTYLFGLKRIESAHRDSEIINERADALNAEALDVLTYQKIH
ncbi:hypothetical protein LLG95_17565 [bacterium]|nr:hypothetical protein [bacterium]